MVTPPGLRIPGFGDGGSGKGRSLSPPPNSCIFLHLQAQITAPCAAGGEELGEHKRPHRGSDPERKRGARGPPCPAWFLMLPIQPRGGERDVGRGETGGVSTADLMPLPALHGHGDLRGVLAV